MRDLVILAIFGVGVLYALRNPFIGLQLFMWISVMNPHRYGWGLTYNMPLAMIASAITLLGVLLNLNKVRFPWTRDSVLFLILWGWITLTTMNALYPEDAWFVWTTVTKIFVMTLVAMVLINTRQRLVLFLIMIIGCLGFIGVKGAMFGVLNRGVDRVWGPPGSFLEDNNSLALAMVMVAPLALFMREVVPKRWQSRALLAVGLSQIVSALLTYSRGGLLGVAATSLVGLTYAKHKFRILIACAALVAVAYTVLPPTWFARMSTIKTYEKDDSARMRMNSWRTAVNLAKAHPLGGGFDCFTMEVYYAYAPLPELGRTLGGQASTAHSIYFEVLAMHGFGGLAIFLACLLSMFFGMRDVERRVRKVDPDDPAIPLSRGLRIGVIGFMVSGAFLSRAFFDVFWAIYAAGACLRYMVLSGAWNAASAATSAPLGAAGQVVATRPATEPSVPLAQGRG